MRSEDYKLRQAKSTIRQRPFSQELNFANIRSDLAEINEACSDIRWMDDTLDETLGEDDAGVFRLQFADLSADCERLQGEIDDYAYTWTFVGEKEGESYFDALWAGSAGADDLAWYDEVDGDFVQLHTYTMEYAERIAAARVERLTKPKIIELVGDSIWLVRTYMSVKYRYNMLRGVFDLITERGMEWIRTAQSIETAWAKWTESDRYEDERVLDRLLSDLPDRVWIE